MHKICNIGRAGFWPMLRPNYSVGTYIIDPERIKDEVASVEFELTM